MAKLPRVPALTVIDAHGDFWTQTLTFCPFCKRFHIHGANADHRDVGSHCHQRPGGIYQFIIVGSISHDGAMELMRMTDKFGDPPQVESFIAEKK